MAVTVETIANADTSYGSKINGNFAVLAAAVTALQNQMGGAAGLALNLSNVYTALFGSAAAVIGAGSYLCAIVGQTVTVAAGYAFLPTLGAVVHTGGGTVDLTGLADGTYYVKPDASGAPIYSATPTDALYSVVKTGTSLGTLTRVAAISWGQTDWAAAQSSAALGAFTSLDGRFEAIESGIAPLYVTGAFVAGTPGNAALMFAILPTVAVSYAANFTGSRAKAGVAATAETVLVVKKNGVQCGTITFAASGTSGTFASTGGLAVSLTTTDELTIENQATADATLADIRFVLHGAR